MCILQGAGSLDHRPLGTVGEGDSEGDEMTKIKDGGPAFPAPAYGYSPAKDGMTLRDYLAAKAMEAFIIKGHFWSDDLALSAKVCFEMADEMLKERDREA